MIDHFKTHGVVALALTLTLTVLPAAIDYDGEIAPIFRSYCAGCHNDQELEGEFSLETYAGLREGGDKGDPIKPGDAENSYLIRVIEGHSKPKMPPKDEPQLNPSDLATLKAWITEGATGAKEDRSVFSHLVVPKLAASQGDTPITALAYSPDGTLRALGKFARVEIMDQGSGELRRVFTDLEGKVNGLEFSPDGKQILLATGITGLKGLAQLWDMESGQLIQEFGQHRDVLYDAAFSPDGQVIATAGYDQVIHLWDKQQGTLIRSLTAHQGAVFDLAFHPSGDVLASASADETVKLWRVRDGVRLDTLSQPQGEQVSVCFTKDGEHVVSGGADKRLHLWKLVSREKPGLNPVIHSRFAHDAAITAILSLPDGKHLLSSAADRSLKLWSLPDLTEVHAYPPLPDRVSELAALPQEPAFTAACMDGSMVTLNVRVPQPEVSPVVANLASDRVTFDRSEVTQMDEVESDQAQSVTLPVAIRGTIQEPGDVDRFRFSGKAGQSLFLGVNAARSESLLDSKIAVLSAEGKPIEQVRLQATRDSWFTFRGKSSDDSNDFRVHNWAEMELNEYLYSNGEVSRLWLYPRGPDSGFKVYPGAGKRHSYFFTTALSHPLGAPCYIVEPIAAGAKVVPNGLPVYTVYWENDDDPLRRWGSDSQLWFAVPEDGDYFVEVGDVRGFGGEEDYHYTLTMRDRQPDFEVTVSGTDPKVSPGSGREVRFSVERHEGFDGPIDIRFENLPEGFTMTSPLMIQAEQHEAIGVLWASSSAVAPNEAADKAVNITAVGNGMSKELGTLGDIQLAEPAKVTVQILPNALSEPVETGKPLVLVIHPGETISARVLATRHDFDGRIEFGNEDSGRNLPHGLYVDNIGLNGLLIVEGQTERDFFITAAPWVLPGERLFHLRTNADGGQASRPVVIRVLGRGDAQ